MNPALSDPKRFDNTRKGGVKYFISDLHLGDGSKADDFHYTDELIRFLNFAKGSSDELIIVGDLFELWQCDLDKVLFYHDRVIKELLKFAKDKKLTYIIGNHDHIPFVKYIDSGINITTEYSDDTLKLYAEHGNQYDIFNRYENPKLPARNRLGRIISYIAGIAERTIHPDIDEMIVPSTDEYKKRGGDFTEYDNAAKELIKKGKKIVIFGHTHQAKVAGIENGIYANCGAWCGSVKPTYVAVDDKSVELRDAITNKGLTLK